MVKDLFLGEVRGTVSQNHAAGMGRCRLLASVRPAIGCSQQGVHFICAVSRQDNSPFLRVTWGFPAPNVFHSLNRKRLCIPYGCSVFLLGDMPVALEKYSDFHALAYWFTFPSVSLGPTTQHV
jgi:hypothetical protein